jgi:hypothetical protein
LCNGVALGHHGVDIGDSFDPLDGLRLGRQLNGDGLRLLVVGHCHRDLDGVAGSVGVVGAGGRHGGGDGLAGHNGLKVVGNAAGLLMPMLLVCHGKVRVEIFRNVPRIFLKFVKLIVSKLVFKKVIIIFDFEIFRRNSKKNSKIFFPNFFFFKKVLKI